MYGDGKLLWKSRVLKSRQPAEKLDAQTGRITGVLHQKGESIVTLRVANAVGVALGQLKIVCGEQLALTPPMGWNSWNCFAAGVDDAKIRASADAMVTSGLVNHGWSYINIDDCWAMQGDNARDPNGRITCNNKFSDMNADLGISGKQIVRDLWRQQDLGTFEGSFTTKVPRHGVLLVPVRPAAK